MELGHLTQAVLIFLIVGMINVEAAHYSYKVKGLAQHSGAAPSSVKGVSNFGIDNSILGKAAAEIKAKYQGADVQDSCPIWSVDVGTEKHYFHAKKVPTSRGPIYLCKDGSDYLSLYEHNTAPDITPNVNLTG